MGASAGSIPAVSSTVTFACSSMKTGISNPSILPASGASGPAARTSFSVSMIDPDSSVTALIRLLLASTRVMLSRTTLPPLDAMRSSIHRPRDGTSIHPHRRTCSMATVSSVRKGNNLLIASASSRRSAPARLGSRSSGCDGTYDDPARWTRKAPPPRFETVSASIFRSGTRCGSPVRKTYPLRFMRAALPLSVASSSIKSMLRSINRNMSRSGHQLR